MLPTEILSSEHRVIEQVLTCLERIVGRAQTEGRLDEPSARQALDFFRNFTDRCHHSKEETHLFPAMESRGFPRDGGPTGVMLQEHEMGRSYVQGMEEAIPAAAAGEPGAVKRFAHLAWGYLGLLREHIEKEDHCLFRMANQALRDEDQQALRAAFDRVESDHMGAGAHEKFLRIATELAERYGVEPAAPAAACHHGCGHP